MPDPQVGVAEDIEAVADDVFADQASDPMAPGADAGAPPAAEAPTDENGVSVEYQPLVEQPEPTVANVVESKWDVVAMGELQQPGGVGATNVHNPVVDGPNPDGPNFLDNSGNSHEQEVALKRWVDLTVDMLNRGENPDAILAKLAHDGCPDPAAVLQRAMDQPQQEAPITDEASSAPQTPAVPPDASNTMSMPMGVQASKSLSEIEQTRKRVHVAGMGNGYVVAEFKDIYDREVVKVALDEGTTVDTAPEHVKEIAEAVNEPVHEIQSFLDSLPPVNPENRQSVAARIENIKTARAAAARALSSDALDYQQRLALDELHTELGDDLKEFGEYLGEMVTPADQAALDALPQYEMGAEVHATASVGHGHKADQFLDNSEHVASEAEGTDWAKEIREGAAILVSEANVADLQTGYISEIAGGHIRRKTAGLAPEKRAQIITSYMERVKTLADERLAGHKPEATAHVATNTTDDGPASGLFL